MLPIKYIDKQWKVLLAIIITAVCMFVPLYYGIIIDDPIRLQTPEEIRLVTDEEVYDSYDSKAVKSLLLYSSDPDIQCDMVYSNGKITDLPKDDPPEVIDYQGKSFVYIGELINYAYYPLCNSEAPLLTQHRSNATKKMNFVVMGIVLIIISMVIEWMYFKASRAIRNGVDPSCPLYLVPKN